MYLFKTRIIIRVKNSGAINNIYDAPSQIRQPSVGLLSKKKKKGPSLKKSSKEIHIKILLFKIIYFVIKFEKKRKKKKKELSYPTPSLGF